MPEVTEFDSFTRVLSQQIDTIDREPDRWTWIWATFSEEFLRRVKLALEWDGREWLERALSRVKRETSSSLTGDVQLLVEHSLAKKFFRRDLVSESWRLWTQPQFTEDLWPTLDMVVSAMTMQVNGKMDQLKWYTESGELFWEWRNFVQLLLVVYGNKLIELLQEPSIEWKFRQYYIETIRDNPKYPEFYTPYFSGDAGLPSFRS